MLLFCEFKNFHLFSYLRHEKVNCIYPSLDGKFDFFLLILKIEGVFIIIKKIVTYLIFKRLISFLVTILSVLNFHFYTAIRN